MGNDAVKRRLQFVHPEPIGFNTTDWPELGIETIVISNVIIGGKSVGTIFLPLFINSGLYMADLISW